MVCITGDTHGNFSRVEGFARWMQLTPQDTIVILGDAGFNYYLNERDDLGKQAVNCIGCTVFCIHGNHEERPFNIPSYKTKEWRGGTVWFEEKYPNLLFAKDGEVYNLDGMKCIAVGGAYSVDKFYRLKNYGQWFPDEQPSEAIKSAVEARLEAMNWKVDVVLSHTCPHTYEPIECFLPMVDQTTVDKSTEEWLDTIEQKLQYKKWYCGHWHTIKNIDKLQFMFNDFDILSERNIPAEER